VSPFRIPCFARSKHVSVSASVEPNNRAAWFVSVAISPRVFARRLIVLRLSSPRDPPGSSGFLRPWPTFLPGVARGVFTLPTLERSGSVIAGVNQGSIMEGQLP
jgi:hypothetical protein